MKAFIRRWLPWLVPGYWRLRKPMKAAHDFLVRRAQMSVQAANDLYRAEGFPGVRQPKAVPYAVDPRYADIVFRETATCPCCREAGEKAPGIPTRWVWPLAECMLDPIGGDTVYSTRFFVYCPDCMTPMDLPAAFREPHCHSLGQVLNLDGGRHGR